jgi:hypothetical protein
MVRLAYWTFVAAILVSFAKPALAVDGVIEINQARAQAGGITATDAPGFPVTIDSRGSYRLTGNISSGSGVTAILITADEVSIDLNGFTIRGCVPPPFCLPTSEQSVGVDARSASSTSISNGSVSGMNGTGINGGRNARIAAVHTMGNGGTGIACSAGCIVVHVTSQENGGSGISCSDCVVSESTAIQNDSDGIFASPGTVTDNFSWANGGDGIRGSGLIRHNNAHNNTGDGIDIVAGAAIGNSSINNGGFGLRLSSVGYSQNVLQGNGGLAATHVTGGTSLGHNLCGTGTC